MALTNVLGSTYTIVKDVQLFSKDRNATLDLVTYTDSAKDVELSRLNICIEGSNPGMPLDGKGDATPPGSPAEGDTYLLGASPTGDWSTFSENDVVRYNGATWDVMGADMVGTSDGKTWSKKDDGTWVESLRYISQTEFDVWFSPAAMDGAGKNLIERAYAYVKTRPEFSTATDL